MKVRGANARNVDKTWVVVKATLITELPAREAHANKTTGVFLSKIERECEDDNSTGEDVLDDDHNAGVALQGGFVRYDGCGAITATATATTATRTKWLLAQKSASPLLLVLKKLQQKRKVKMPSKRSNRVIDKDKRSRSTKSKPQVLGLTASVLPKKPTGRKMTQTVMAPPPAAMTVAKKRKKKSGWKNWNGVT